jgi:hypothetical protein
MFLMAVSSENLIIILDIIYHKYDICSPAEIDRCFRVTHYLNLLSQARYLYHLLFEI